MPFLTETPIETAEFFSQAAAGPEAGALAAFLGIVRNHHGGRAVRELFYESYGPMAERRIAELVEEARGRWPLRVVRLAHRTGRLRPGETAVAVGVWSDHRAEAFEASRFLIDAVKASVPIWKYETYEDGTSEWVSCEKNENHRHRRACVQG